MGLWYAFVKMWIISFYHNCLKKGEIYDDDKLLRWSSATICNLVLPLAWHLKLICSAPHSPASLCSAVLCYISTCSAMLRSIMGPILHKSDLGSFIGKKFKFIHM